jgi:hypothetical protein
MAATTEGVLSDPAIAHRVEEMGTPAMRGWSPEQPSCAKRTPPGFRWSAASTSGIEGGGRRDPARRRHHARVNETGAKQ